MPERDKRLLTDSGGECSQPTPAVGVHDDFGYQEAEYSTGRTKGSNGGN